MLVDELVVYLFNDQPHLLAQPMATWLNSSRRFVTFATTFRDKIRKKLRTTQRPENLLDLRLELETAYLLLQERTLNLDYEPLQSKPGRSPDFAVTYTTSLTFMVEVTRLRGAPPERPTTAQAQTPATLAPNLMPPIPPLGERLADSVCSKLGQLRPQHGNVLLVGVEAQQLTQEDVDATMLYIQQRAQQNDAPFLRRHRFRDRADFFRHYQRLSEMLVRGLHDQAAAPLAVWLNPQAKQPLPGKVRTALHRSQAQG